jgi:hypothetical protein
MKTILGIFALALNVSVASADAVGVNTYQDILDNSYPINLVKPVRCFGGSLPGSTSFDTIQVLAVAGSPSRVEVVAFVNPNLLAPVEDILVDLAANGSFHFDPNFSGDPIFKFRAAGVNRADGSRGQLECASSY